jgi:hypothetical protein
VKERSAALGRAARRPVFVTSGLSGRGHEAVLRAAREAIHAAHAEALA